ncbi:hypothetical protein PMAYCL1PPCAC_06650 [Pristionchus mayeri]|uniref:Uncharacterized protein n=1 Tax=Pristionchus mayeri TaxID=1317129 RepID=A0AAN5CA76_9BILA|nr:hypothetical protein PMAYCL1PPCAC_06650 [Pristionchus mayeri]
MRVEAFAAWTDYAKGETPPCIGTLCTLTCFRQGRLGKKQLRAVLVEVEERTTRSRNRSRPLPVHNLPRGMNGGVSRASSSSVSIGCYGSLDSIMSQSSQSVDAMGESREDLSRSRSLSATSNDTCSPFPSPSIDFLPLFFDYNYVPWHPIDENN